MRKLTAQKASSAGLTDEAANGSIKFAGSRRPPNTVSVRPTAAGALARGEGVPLSSPKKEKAEEPATATAPKKATSASKSTSWLVTGVLHATAKVQRTAKLPV